MAKPLRRLVRGRCHPPQIAISRFAPASATNSPRAGTRIWEEPSNYVTAFTAFSSQRRRSAIRYSRKTTPQHLFSPRVGLAWDVFGNGKTAVRAGFGTYYSLIDDLAFLMNSLPLTTAPFPVPAHYSRSYLSRPRARLRVALSHACARMPLRESRLTRKRRRWRNGISQSSRS